MKVLIWPGNYVHAVLFENRKFVRIPKQSDLQHQGGPQKGLWASRTFSKMSMTPQVRKKAPRSLWCYNHCDAVRTHTHPSPQHPPANTSLQFQSLIGTLGIAVLSEFLELSKVSNSKVNKEQRNMAMDRIGARMEYKSPWNDTIRNSMNIRVISGQC